MQDLSRNDVAGVVVSYNSNIHDILENIDTYITQVSFLFVVDNSETENLDLKHRLSNINRLRYLWMGGNYGIASALNVAAESSIKGKYKYLLMMDDDSKLLEGTIVSMIDFIKCSSNHDNIAIVCTQADKNLINDTVSDDWYVITSGSLLNLNAYSTCGPFLEDLFIDGVDHEYCYRLKKYGYNIHSLNYLYMHHKLGESKSIYFFNKKIFSWSSHSPVRSYYLLRNFLRILNTYKNLLPSSILYKVYYGVIKACLLDLLIGGHFFTRLRYLILAIEDYRVNTFGKFYNRN